MKEKQKEPKYLCRRLYIDCQFECDDWQEIATHMESHHHIQSGVEAQEWLREYMEIVTS